MTDRGLGSWTDDLSARERVREIATTLTEPQSVEWVREEARVSAWQTAKDELEMLVEFGQLQAVEGDDGNTKYAPNYQLRYVSEVTELINTHTREELREEIADIQAEIDEWKTEYEVGSRDELESTLTDDDLDSTEIRDRNRALRQWERYEDNKRLLKHALELYEDAQELHPGRNDSSNSSTPLSQ
jgi:NTP pyrophosphatase (non-canonical NTP hydrolase)